MSIRSITQATVMVRFTRTIHDYRPVDGPREADHDGSGEADANG